jgi:hypothetical protein
MQSTKLLPIDEMFEGESRVLRDGRIRCMNPGAKFGVRKVFSVWSLLLDNGSIDW